MRNRNDRSAARLVVLALMIIVVAATAGQRIPAESGLTNRAVSATSAFAPDRFLVKFKQDVVIRAGTVTIQTGNADIDALNRRWGIVEARPVFPGKPNALARRMGLHRVYVLAARKALDVPRAVAEYRGLAQVAYAEPDHVGSAMAAPDDPYFSDQWGLDNTGQNPGGSQAGTPGCDIDATQAWNVETGSHDVIVGDLDTGLDLSLSEFLPDGTYGEGQIWHNVREIPGNGIDDDGNGYVDDTVGWNFVSNNNNVQDDDDHGTHTAGIIGAKGNNNLGVSGTCWYTRIMPVKVLDNTGHGSYSWWCSGIYYAVNNGARIINMSMGGTDTSTTLLDAINYAWNSGVLPVVSMGNSGDSTKYYPAGYDNVIAVGMTDNNDTIVRYGVDGAPYGSSYGSWVDVMAPGNWILSTVRGAGNYQYWVGTSMAAPFVTGVAALMLARNPDLTNVQLRDIIRSTAVDLGAPGFDNIYGYGRVNAYQALQQVQFLPDWAPETLLAASVGANRDNADIAASGTNVHIVLTDEGQSPTGGLYYVRSTNSGRSFDTCRNIVPWQSGWEECHARLAVNGATLHVVFVDDRSGLGQIYYKRSTDNGATWSSDVQISNSSVDCLDPDVCLVGDTIHVIWASGYRRSTDAGTTWGTINAAVSGDAIAAGGGKLYAVLDSDNYSVDRIYLRRFNGTSWESPVRLCGDSNCMGADVATDGNHVYVTWTQDMDGDGWFEDIHFRRSSDAGANWDTIRRITALGHNLDNEYPRLAAGNNRVQLVWQGDRDQYMCVQAYWQQSTDDGGTWGHCHRLTYNSNWSELPAIAFVGDTIHAAWDRMLPGKSVYYMRTTVQSVFTDVGVSRIITPTGSFDSSVVVVPSAKVRNLGSGPATFKTFFTISGGWHDSVQVSHLAAGDSATVVFDTWPKPHALFGYTTRCSTWLAGDLNNGNDTINGSFTVTGGIVPTQGWTQEPGIPPGGKSKSVKDGGCLAYGRATGGGDTDHVFALKSNSTCEFYRFNTRTNAWIAQDSIPAIGRSGKKKTVKKGAALVVGTDGRVYGTKGNNTCEFWCYDPVNPAGSRWTQLNDVPSGAKALKEGTGLAAASVSGTGYIYVLKGSGTFEFYRYKISDGSWQTMADAPGGLSGRPYKYGSSLTYDGRDTIWAMKGSCNELFAYSISQNNWVTKDTMPKKAPPSTRKTKVKDGSQIASDGNRTIYALKGDNTNEFWTYLCNARSWIVATAMPSVIKKVKGGGGLVYAGNLGCLYALRGNNTLEFWKYVPTSAYCLGPLANGQPKDVQGQSAARGPQFALSVTPNPFTNRTNISYSLPKSGSISLKLYDATGKMVSTLASGYHTSGSYSYSLLTTHYSLVNGIYVLRLDSEGNTTTQKIINE